MGIYGEGLVRAERERERERERMTENWKNSFIAKIISVWLM